jgi:hypothetical protein
MVSYLLANGADPTIKDATGRDAFAIALHLKRDRVVKILHEQAKGMLKEKLILADKLALSTAEVKTEKTVSKELKNCLVLKEQEIKKMKEENLAVKARMEQFTHVIATREKQIAVQDQEINKLSEEKKDMKTWIEQLAHQMECSIQTTSMGEKKIRDLCEEIEKLKTKKKSATLDDFAILLRNNLSETHSHLEHHVNFDEMCSKPLASLSRDIRFLEALSKDISEQVLKVVQGQVDEKKNIEIYVARREQKRIEIIQIIRNLKISLKQEQDKIASIRHLLIFDNKLDSKKLDELCSMRSKLTEMDKELELRLLTIPKHLEECNQRIDKILQLKKELEEKDEKLDKLEGTVKSQFKKNSPEYKSQMSKLEIQRNEWRQDGVKLEIAKQEMVNELLHYPELRFKLEEEGESSEDPYQSFKNYLKSVNLLIDLNLKDHFPIRKNFKESIHLLNCINLQGERKFLKKFAR